MALSAVTKSSFETRSETKSETMKPTARDLDPRSDITKDHRLWIAVLAIAHCRNKQLYGLLHGLRCLSARLTVQQTSRDNDYIKLDYQPVVETGTWSEAELRARWLDPHKEQIKWVFRQALVIKKQAQAEMGKANLAGKGQASRVESSPRSSEPDSVTVADLVLPDLEPTPVEQSRYMQAKLA